MTSSSTEPAVVRDLTGTTVRAPRPAGDLRSGTWTRLGGNSVLGDKVTESLLQGVAEETRAAARAQGYAVGWSEGRRAGEAQARTEAERAAQERLVVQANHDAEHQQAVAALRRAARQLQDTLAQVSAAVEGHAVGTALELAEAVLGREVALATDPALDAVRRALALMPAQHVVTLRLHPLDLGTLDAAALTELTEASGHTVRLVDDASLGRGDAVAESDTCVVDASVDAALGRVREVLAS